MSNKQVISFKIKAWTGCLQVNELYYPPAGVMQALSSPFWASFIKSPSSCRDWDWVCVRIFQDRSKTTETKRSAQTPARPLHPLGSLQGPLGQPVSYSSQARATWAFLRAACLPAVLTLTPTPTVLLKECVSIC